MFKQAVSSAVFLCLFLIISFPAYSGNVIVAYDYSGSMCKLGKMILMKSEDLDRLNTYLVHIIYDGRPKRMLPNDAEIIMDLGSEPLYTESGWLSLFQFDKNFKDLISQEKVVSRKRFREALPNSKLPFLGQESFVHEAELRMHEIADSFYESSDSKEVTYGIIVSDLDEDTSTATRKNPRILRKLAELKKKYDTEVIYDLLVNRHVNIVVYRMVPKGSVVPPTKIPPTIPVAAPFKNFVLVADKTSITPLRKIELTKEGKWLNSVPLFVNSRDDLPASFEPQKLIVSTGKVKQVFDLNAKKPLPQGFMLKFSSDRIDPRWSESKPRFLLGYRNDGIDHIVPINQRVTFLSPPGNSGPAIIIVILVLMALAMIAFLIWYLMKRSRRDKHVSFFIETSGGVFSKNGNFILPDGSSLGLGGDSSDYYAVFDVGSSNSSLKNKGGKLDLYTSEESRKKLAENDEFSVVNKDGETISMRIRSEDAPQKSEKEEVFSEIAGRPSGAAGEDSRLDRI